MDHPHLLEGYLSAAQDGLRLRDFKRWLAVLRGKSMPTSFAWSYKRTYKNGFIWHDLGDNDLVQPLSKNEYVLMGSEIKEQGVTTGKCKCGGIQQQADTKIVAEAAGGNGQEEALNKPVMRSPKVVAKICSSYNAEDQHRNIDGLTPNNVTYSPARLGLISSTTENKFHDNGIRISSRGNLYRVGGLSRSFNDLTTQRLLEEVKTPTNHHDTAKHLATRKGFNSPSSRGPSSSVSMRDCEIIAEELDYITDDIDARRKGDMGGADHIDVNEDDSDGTYIMDAATQTGDSTRCSTEDHQDGTKAASTGYSNMLEMVGSPGASAKLSAIQRESSSARFNNSSHSHGHTAKGNLPMHLSQDFSNLPDVEKSNIMINRRSENGDVQNVGGHVSMSNHTSLHNHMGSPGALSSCSGMSARSSTRFAREEGNRMPLPAASNNSAKKYGIKSEDHHHHHHRHHHLSKGASSQYSSSTSTSAMASSSGSHTLLKQLLTCGNADVVSEKKHTNAADNVIMISNINAVSGLQTPSRATKGAYIQQEGDKSKNVLCGACKPAGLMKRINSAASSDNRSVISATASEQGSMRDTTEMISSPESVYGSANHRHLKRDMIRAHSLSTSSTAAALRSRAVQLSSKDHTSASAAASHKKTQHQQLTDAAGSTSPGMRSVGSSTSRRSSISKNEVNIVGAGDVEEGFHEALQSHHIGGRVSSKSRANKGNKNTLLINDILEENEASHDGTREYDADITNAKKGGSKTHSTTVSELHKLICNPTGTPTCGNHNKVASTNFVVPLEQSGHIYNQAHSHNNTQDSYTPQHAKSHHMLIASQRLSRTPYRSNNLNSPNVAFLSKSLNSPSSLFLDTQPRTTSSNYVNSWKDLLWSPRNGSSQKEREKRHMKP